MADSVESAGVAFSRGQYGLKATIEIVYGLGEGLVSGLITPDRIIADASSKETIEYSVADKRNKIVPNEGKEGVETRIVEKEKRKVRILDAPAVKQLTRIIIDLEKDAGYPVDVEFAIGKQGKIYILQRRPITTVEAVRGERAASYNTLAVVSGNIDESLEQPFMYVRHPNLQGEAVGVYFSRAFKGGAVIVKIEDKYKYLVSEAGFIASVMERIDTDKIARDKLNSHIPINIDRIIPGKFEIVPFYNLGIADKDFTQSLPKASSSHDLLSAA
jgi:hypothetical protein